MFEGHIDPYYVLRSQVTGRCLYDTTWNKYKKKPIVDVDNNPRLLPLLVRQHGKSEVIMKSVRANLSSRHRGCHFTTSAKTWIILLIAALAGTAGISAGRADEADAKRLFRAMSDYLGTQQAISFDYDVSLELVSTQQQKVALASSGTATLDRPDKIHLTRRGGFANVEMVFDGKTLTLLGKNTNLYTQVQAPGTIDQLVDVLRDKYHRPLPAADLLMSNPYNELMPEVNDVKDLGSGVIRGMECDHLAFRTKDVDWQIWIAQGAHPYPCRYVITSKKVTGFPEYTLDIWAWKTGSEVASDSFTLAIPAGAKKLAPSQVPELNDIPGIFIPKGAK